MKLFQHMPDPVSLMISRTHVLWGEPSKESVCWWVSETQSQMATKLPTHCRCSCIQWKGYGPVHSHLGPCPLPLAFLCCTDRPLQLCLNCIVLALCRHHLCPTTLRQISRRLRRYTVPLLRNGSALRAVFKSNGWFQDRGGCFGWNDPDSYFCCEKLANWRGLIE